MATPRDFTAPSSSPYVAGLQTGAAWTPGDTITFYLAPSDLDGNGVDDWVQDGAGAAMEAAYASWAAVANIKVERVFTQAEAVYTERFAVDAGSGTAFHNLPTDVRGPDIGGTYDIDRLLTAESAQGGRSYLVMTHEVGHGMGLGHPHDGAAAFPGVDSSGDSGDNGLNQQLYTVMSYVEGVDGSPSPSRLYGWSGGPMAFDIAAMQAIYGANMATATGDDTYVLPDANELGTFYLCIWDAGGTDTISAAGLGRDVTIDLRDATLRDEPGGGGYLSAADDIWGGYTIAAGAQVENATGGKGDDRLTGNEGRNTLIGGAGADRLDGGAGVDAASYDGAAKGVTASLGGGQGKGDAKGDTFNGVENLLGSGAADRLTGDAGANLLGGRDGSDTLAGGAGDDRLKGAGGTDSLTGGSGRDAFIFSTAPGAGSGVDVVTDFKAADDAFQLDPEDFGGLAEGVLAASRFKDLDAPGARVDGDDRILYDRSEGLILWDRDGSGSGAAVAFARVAAGTALTADDFLIG